MIDWKTTTFEANPIATDLVGQTFAYIQDTRKAVGERLRAEHDMDDTHGTSGQGVHNMGSARGFIFDKTTDLPAGPTIVPTYVLADGVSKGRISFKRYDEILGGSNKIFYKIFVYYKDADVEAWTEPSYVHLGNVAETMYGVKTFFDWPAVSDITGVAENDPYAGHSDSTLVPVGALKRALLDQVASLQNAIIPIGFLYVQYPGFASPNDLWSWATWSYSEAATAFAGAFFRAEGTGALGFGAGLQVQQLESHAHALTYVDSCDQGLSADQTDGGVIDHDTVGNDHRIATLPSSTEVYPSAENTENRPKNFTMRIWKRTA